MIGVMWRRLRDVLRKLFSFLQKDDVISKVKVFSCFNSLYSKNHAISKHNFPEHKKTLKEKMNPAFRMITTFVILCTFVWTSLSCDPVPMIKSNEGHKPCMYLDIKGIKTIGYGYNMQNADAPDVFKQIGADFNKFFNGPLTPAKTICNCSAVPCLKENQIDALLEISVKTAIADAESVIKSFATLCCPVQNVMVDMAYTLGGSSFRAFTTFSKLVDRQYWKMAGDDLTCSKWCNAKGQDTKRCHRDAAIISKGCGCSGPYPQVCPPTASSCCGSQETCCKAVFTYKSFITKTFNEVACCPSLKATCCTHNRCCKEDGVCCPAAPAEPTYCCYRDYPHCAPGRMCSRDGSHGGPMIPGTEIFERKGFH